MKRVLLVDDQAAIRRLISEVLEEDFNIMSASNGEDAVGVAEKFKPDVILLDIGLPGISGIDLIPIFKEISPKSKILMLTGSISNSTMNQAKSLGVSGFIEKPFDILEIKNEIMYILQQ
jgi:CheY-like chemotaxis protein